MTSADNNGYEDLVAQIDKGKLPQHIAIIMDGNGRWAKQRNLLRSIGHREGMEALRHTVEICRDTGIKILTVYAFSTENWLRPKEEVSFLMSLFVEYLRSELALLNKQDIRLQLLGDSSRLPVSVQRELEHTLAATKNNQSMIFNIAVNYGSRTEITAAVKRIASLVEAGELNADEIDQQMISDNLYTAGQADPDLLIRTSAERRLSNFLLWQLAYTEVAFIDKYWPDFGKRDLLAAIIEYQHRDRRFGGV